MPRSSRKERETLHRSAPAAARPQRPRRVLLAAPRSFCAGVERAVDVVAAQLEQGGGTV
ncbi:hypothetical protein [Streptomyces sp. NPDC059788]|uniref:hypothetical protein n=1 Tax=Streptomyces sp. NPDC059788 TaxID=3346948 RepID=UPI0036625442